MRRHFSLLLGPLLLGPAFACTGPAGIDGASGADGSSCSFTQDSEGTLLVSCQDGSLAVVRKGDPGAPGQDAGEGGAGPDAPLPLVAVDPATALQCPRGGTVVSAGLDLDGDRILAATEITSQAPVCRPGPPCDVVFGDVTLGDPLRLVAFGAAGCREVRGTLLLESPGIQSLTRLSSLGQVDALILRNTFLRTLRGTSLSGEIGSLVIENNPVLVSLAGLEGIAGVRGRVRIANNRFLCPAEVDLLVASIGPVGGPVETGNNGDASCP